MSIDKIHQWSNKVCGANEIRFLFATETLFNKYLVFELDGQTTSWIPSEYLKQFLTSEKYSEGLETFMDKLSNPVKFMNNSIIRSMELPTGLKLKVAMTTLVGIDDV